MATISKNSPPYATCHVILCRSTFRTTELFCYSVQLPRDLTHSGILKFMEGVPVFNIFDDSNWFDRHLVVCGSGMGGMMAHNLVLQVLCLNLLERRTPSPVPRLQSRCQAFGWNNPWMCSVMWCGLYSVRLLGIRCRCMVNCC